MGKTLSWQRDLCIGGANFLIGIGDEDHFVATTIAQRLDDDPAIDEWQIDEKSTLRCVIDNSVVR